MKRTLKCIFIPFYWGMNHKFNDRDNPIPWFYGFLLSLYILARLGIGLESANKEGECIVRSIGDVIITPMYTLGCNIGKDRFEIRVN